MPAPTTAPVLPAKTSIIGKPIDRVDGPLKVTGAARYAVDFPLPRMTHAVAVTSTIGAGRIADIDDAQASASPGVLAVLTHRNIGRLREAHGRPGQSMVPLQGDPVFYFGQYVALVVAETLEQAQAAAAKLKIRYEAQPPSVELDHPLEVRDHGTGGRGDADAAFASAAVKTDNTYASPTQHHNPMETHGTIAVWQGSKLTIYDATQNIQGSRDVVASTLGVPAEDVRVIDPFVGGGFGSKGSVWPNSYLAAAAARHVGRPVKLVVDRHQQFFQTGHRAETRQHVALAADADGRLQSIIHETLSRTAAFQDWVEQGGRVTPMLYECPNVRVTQKVARCNVGMPCQMRAPGEAMGTYALESAMDELAYALKIDPLELRLRNYAEVDQASKPPGLPFTSKSLRQCYEQAAQRFGWSTRSHEPRSMRDGDVLIGWGMATSTYPAGQQPSSASVRLEPSGMAVVSASAEDLGTGTYTILAQIAAETLGLPVDQVRVEIGDSNFPRAPGAGGSTLAVSVGSAVRVTAYELVKNIAHFAVNDPSSPLAGAKIDELTVHQGRLVKIADATVGEPLMAVFKRNGNRAVSATEHVEPDKALSGKYSRYSFGAQMVEVRVDPTLGTVRLSRAVGVFAAGRILNHKTARNQLMGGMIMGYGAALLEHSVYDQRSAKVVNNNLADYLVATNADVPKVEVICVDEQDDIINPLGAKGVGELGITGAAAAVANAVYHATGVRVRDLPIMPEKVMGAV